MEYHYFMTMSLMLMMLCLVVSSNNGKYRARANNYGDDGKYKRPRDEGKYVHIPNPYGGGYGPYSGDWERYKHQEYLDAEESNKQQVSVTPAPTPPPTTIKYINNGNKIIRQNQALKDDGFKYLYETENKILAVENAVVKNANTPDEGIATSGFYQYVGPDGVLYRVTFTADENGFRPKMTRVNYPESLDDGFTKLSKNTI